MEVVDTFAAVRAHVRGVVGFVPTLGYVHEGHLSLMGAARATCDTLVASIWVNPLQFDDPADLDAYPRAPGRDVDLCRDAGVDIVFLPTRDVMHPPGFATTVSVAGVGEGMEGAHRPGHFDGVATVVAKLFGGVRPDRAHFGRKDAQQLAVIRAMVRDLSIPVEVVAGSTVREADGLALSSRNVRLAPDDRARATAIPQALFGAADLAEAGAVDTGTLVEAVTDQLVAAGLDPAYVAVADAHTMEPLDRVDREAVLAVACRVGPIRLIDNVLLSAGPVGVTVDRGTRLEGPSLLYG